jgi:predicted RNA-binding protein (virulence factor B family)
VLGLSKKVFKEALGHMYKRKMVALGPEEVRLQPVELWETGLDL